MFPDACYNILKTSHNNKRQETVQMEKIAKHQKAGNVL
jgi:hypothetical protein